MFPFFTKKDVAKVVDDYLASDKFRESFSVLVEKTIIDIIRETPDEPLSYNGFVLKMAVEIYDRSSPKMTWLQARDHALMIYKDFKRDNKIRKFGHPAWDWSGDAARTIAHEYSIDFWEPS